MIYLKTPSIDTYQAGVPNFRMIFNLIETNYYFFFHSLFTIMFYISKYVSFFFLPFIDFQTFLGMLLTILLYLFHKLLDEKGFNIFSTYFEYSKNIRIGIFNLLHFSRDKY